jgi:hypothetical protein
MWCSFPLKKELANRTNPQMNQSCLFVLVMRASTSPTVRSLFSPASLVLEKQWLEIRDIFFGLNYENRDITQVELAVACEHKEAQWLTRVFAGKTVSTRREARDIFLALGENDARGLCFAALLSGRDENALLRRSAELGCALAQAKMSEETIGEESFRLATLAALQRERDGFYSLGCCFNFGRGCERSEDKAKENFLIAAELGLVTAMFWFGDLLEESDHLCWFWWAQAAKLGEPSYFLRNVAKQVQEFESGSNNAAAVFQIGRALNGNVDVDKRRIFGRNNDFDDLIGAANTAISFCKAQLSACRRAVDAWSHVGLRFKVVKDIRALIGNMIWEMRESALFDVRHARSQPCFE